MTLQQLADVIGIHPSDICGDSDLANDLLEDETDISDTMFYQEMKDLCGADPSLGITLP